MNHYISVLLIALFATTAMADSKKAKSGGHHPKDGHHHPGDGHNHPAKVASAESEAQDREPSSEAEGNLSVHPRRPNPKDWFVRLTAAGGYATLNSNNPQEIQARGDSNYAKNAFGSLSVEGQYGRYFGGEVEGSFGTAKAQNYATVDKVTGLIDTRERKLSQNSVMADVQVRYPISRFRRDWGWHLGGGFGTAGVNSDAPVSGGATVTSSTLRVTGPYATLGVEARLLKEISFGVDYSMSLFGKGKTSTTTATGTTDADLDTGRFDRLRVQLAYLIDTDFRVGLMYNRRMIKGEDTAGNETTETGNQFLAMLSYIL